MAADPLTHAVETALVMADALPDEEQGLAALIYLQGFFADSNADISNPAAAHAVRQLGETVLEHLRESSFPETPERHVAVRVLHLLKGLRPLLAAPEQRVVDNMIHGLAVNVTGWQPDPEVPGLMRRTAENRSGAGGGHPHFVVEQNGEVRAPGFRARREDEPLQAYFESALRHGLAGQDITLDVAGQPAIEPVGRGSQWGRMQAVTEAALEELAREQAREDGLMLPESPPDDDDDDDGSGGIFGGGFFI